MKKKIYLENKEKIKDLKTFEHNLALLSVYLELLTILLCR